MALIETSCAWCGETFQAQSHPSRPRRFCSNRCAAFARNAARRGERPEPAPNPPEQVRLKSKPGVDVQSKCKACGKEFTRRLYASHVARGSKGLYCSSSCAGKGRWLGHGPTASRTRVWAPDHPVSGRSGRALSYRITLYDRIGPGAHPCHWCGELVEWVTRESAGHSKGELAVDHLDGDSRNNTPENLVPACNRCNTLRGLMSAWIEATGLDLEVLMPQRRHG